jgi:hypothetical protein
LTGLSKVLQLCIPSVSYSIVNDRYIESLRCARRRLRGWQR